MAPLNGRAAMVDKFAFDQAHLTVGECGPVPALFQQAPKIVQRALFGVNTDEFDVDQDGLATLLPNIQERFGLAYGLKNNERRARDFLAILVEIEPPTTEAINDGQLDLVLVRQRHQRQEIVDQIVAQERMLYLAMALKQRWRTSPDPCVVWH